jgi:hypothetical protein
MTSDDSPTVPFLFLDVLAPKFLPLYIIPVTRFQGVVTFICPSTDYQQTSTTVASSFQKLDGPLRREWPTDIDDLDRDEFIFGLYFPCAVFSSLEAQENPMLKIAETRRIAYLNNGQCFGSRTYETQIANPRVRRRGPFTRGYRGGRTLSYPILHFCFLHLPKESQKDGF